MTRHPHRISRIPRSGGALKKLAAHLMRKSQLSNGYCQGGVLPARDNTSQNMAGVVHRGCYVIPVTLDDGTTYLEAGEY